MNKMYFITPSLKTGGGNRVFIELANILCSKNDITIMYPNNSEEQNSFYTNPSVIQKAIGSYKKSKTHKLLNICKLIYAINKIDKESFVVFTDPIFSILSRLLTSNKKYRFIQADDYRIFDDGLVLGKGVLLKIFKFLCLASYKDKKTQYIFNSKYVYKQFLNDSRRKDIPFKIVHPAVNQLIFNSNNLTKENSICLVARKHPLKGIQTFLNVWKVLDSSIKKKIEMVYFVSHDDLSSFDLTGITVIKPQNDEEIANIYKKCNFFISTSWSEGFGLPPLEAMFCSCACIISKCGGVDEYAINEVNCIMFEPKNETELMSKLERLLGDAVLQEKLKQNTSNIKNMFTWENSAEQLLEVLKC